MCQSNRNYADKAKKNNGEDGEAICAKYGKEGLNYGEKAKALESNKPEGHYYFGLSVGIYSDGVSNNYSH